MGPKSIAGTSILKVGHIPPSASTLSFCNPSLSFIRCGMELKKYFLNIISIILIMGNTGSSTTDVACNGNAALCSRLYSNVTQIGTHDSAFVGILPTDNQQVSVTDQLDDGIRFLQAQTHVKSGVLELCHTSCTELDAGPLTSKRPLQASLFLGPLLELEDYANLIIQLISASSRHGLTQTRTKSSHCS